MGKLQDIIRYLGAAGGTPSRDGKTTYFTYEKRGSIWMRIWSGSELSEDVLIADGVRPGTSAPIVNRSQKKIFVVHGDSSIKCFIDSLGDGQQVDELDDDIPWDEEEIAGVDTHVHQESQLAVSYDKNTVFVFYQKPNGTLGCINEHNNQWKDVNLPAVTAPAGTPLATCNTNYAVFLFYISTDGTVRYLENREGKWNDVFFSAAKIIDLKAELLPGSAYKLTVAEDRQPFERIRPLVFCLVSKAYDDNILSMIRYRSKRLEEIGAVVQGTEFVPSPGTNMERNKYYFWSPYPFYTMIKRRAKNLTRASISKGLWNHDIKRSHSQQDCDNSSAMKDLNRLQESFGAPTVNNKTAPTVRLEPTIAHATISPQTSGQIPLRSSVFAGFGIIDPVAAIRRGMRLFGNRRNEHAAEEDANHAAIATILPETIETDSDAMDGDVMDGDAFDSVLVEPSRSEPEEVGPRETECAEPENAELTMEQTGADTTLAREDRPPEEAADSEGTEEESGTESGEVETAPSEVEAENEENQSQKVQPGDQGEEHQSLNVQTEEAPAQEHQTLLVRFPEAQTEETDNEEYEGEETEDEESEDEGLENEVVHGEEAHTREPQTEDYPVEDHQVKGLEGQEFQEEKAAIEEVQSKEIQPGQVQPEKAQEKNLQAEEAQARNLHTEDAQKLDAKLKEYEPESSKVGNFEPKARESRYVRWRESEAGPASDKAKVLPTTETSATNSTERPPAMGPYVTEMNGREADVEEPGFKCPGPKESKRTERPIVDKGKGPAAADTPRSKHSRFNSPQDIEDDMNHHIEKNNLGAFFPKGSDFVRALANNAFKSKDNKKNILNRDNEIEGASILNLYQPVLYCDDSTSMNASSRFVGQRGRTRVEDQKEVVRRVARISTSLVERNYGTSLQFINHVRDIYDNNLGQQQVEDIMNSVKPSGHTEIGKNLKEKILKPLIYDVIKNNRVIERPILVSCITDGCPSDKKPERFKEEILRCTRFLKENGYPPSTLKFQVSQIGNSSRATEFLHELGHDDKLREVVYCTALEEHLDEQFSDLRHNEVMLERWLLRTLLEPIIGREVDNLNLY